VKLWTRREAIRDSVRKFEAMYGHSLRLDYPGEIRTRGEVLQELKSLDLDTVSEEDFLRVVGHPSWLEPPACNECGVRHVPTVEIGEQPDYESCTAWVCRKCLLRALALDWPAD
jgi:hypothetical protein